MRTQVAIIGGGPAGLLLSRCCCTGAASTSVVLERQSRDHVLVAHPRRRARVGHGRGAAREPASARAWTREGHVHDGTGIAWAGQRPASSSTSTSTPASAFMAYGQTMIQEDLYAAADRRGARVRVRGRRRQPCTTSTTDRPYVTYSCDGEPQRIDCDFVVGCDGFHGVTRRQRSRPPCCRRTRRSIPFGWLGILSETPPLPDTRLLQPPARLRARLACATRCSAATTSSARSTTRSTTGPTSASGRSCKARFPPSWPMRDRHRAVDREVDRAAAQLRRRADALRPPVPRRRRRPHRAADRRQGPQPRGVGRVLPGARPAPRTTRDGDDHYLDALLRHGAAPGVGLGALLLVAHHAAAPLPRRRPTSTSARRRSSSPTCSSSDHAQAALASSTPACRYNPLVIARILGAGRLPWRARPRKKSVRSTSACPRSCSRSACRFRAGFRSCTASPARCWSSRSSPGCSTCSTRSLASRAGLREDPHRLPAAAAGEARPAGVHLGVLPPLLRRHPLPAARPRQGHRAARPRASRAGS